MCVGNDCSGYLTIGFPILWYRRVACLSQRGIGVAFFEEGLAIRSTIRLLVILLRAAAALSALSLKRVNRLTTGPPPQAIFIFHGYACNYSFLADKNVFSFCFLCSRERFVDESYQVLRILDFTSKRKRMSVIVRDPRG